MRTNEFVCSRCFCEDNDSTVRLFFFNLRLDAIGIYYTRQITEISQVYTLKIYDGFFTNRWGCEDLPVSAPMLITQSKAIAGGTVKFYPGTGVL